MAKRFIGNVKGVGVSDFSWEYYLSSSSAVLDGGSWSATPPTLGNNKYLWMRSKVTLTDGTIQYTAPVCEGVWEEIYGIYAIGDKVDGALSDVTDLKSRMTAEENKVQPINKGGTGATTAEAARENLGVKKCGEYDVLPIAQGGTGKTTAAAALAALGGVSMKKGWSNASPTSTFNPQTITVNGVFDYVIVRAVYDTSYAQPVAEAIVRVGDANPSVLNGTWGGNVSRRVKASSTGEKTTVTFEKGLFYAAGSTAGKDKNGCCMPYEIICVKGVL